MTAWLTPRGSGKLHSARVHREAALRHATARAAPGVWVEAGVAAGDSARFILQHLPPCSRLHLFDSFEGLTRDWWKIERGDFAQEHPPVFDDARVTLHVGWFADTMPAFAHQLGAREVSFLHVDCDLYESAMDVLIPLSERLAVGCVLAFDEAVGHPACVENEGRAIRDWVARSGRQVRELARTGYTQLVLEVIA